MSDEKLSAEETPVEEAQATEPEVSSGKKPKKPKKPLDKKKLGIIVGVVVVVLAVGGIGFWNFHNTPQFCDFLCHNPQDPYNPTYYAEPGQSATDKWGNEVKDASGMMAAVHRVEADANCLSCHEPTLAEQIVEGLEWGTGSFRNPLSERSLTNLVRWHDGMDGTEFCLNSACHDLTKSDLTEKTSYMSRNVHSWHHNEYTCSDCHKSHRASVLVCSQCHSDYTLPEGWITYDEAQELETTYIAYDLESLVYSD